MANKKREKFVSDDELGMDLTPMIDVVFQMIMFFIIITDFSQKDIALLDLPWSTVGEDDEGDDPNRLIINVTAPKTSDKGARDSKNADRILVKGKSLNFAQLYSFLETNGKQNPRFRDKVNPNLSNRSVLVRCDYQQAFDYVKAVLQICSNPEIAIYKIEIATAEKIPEK